MWEEDRLCGDMWDVVELRYERVPVVCRAGESVCVVDLRAEVAKEEDGG